MSLSSKTIDAINAMPKEARADLANEILGAANFLEALRERAAGGVRASAEHKRDQLIAVIRILRG